MAGAFVLSVPNLKWRTSHLCLGCADLARPGFLHDTPMPSVDQQSMTCHYPVINQRGDVAMASEITITGNTIRLVAEGDITQHEWMTLLAKHDLAGRPMHVLDYSISDYGTGDTVIHQWLMQLAHTDTPLRVAP